MEGRKTAQGERRKHIRKKKQGNKERVENKQKERRNEG
jgi:hypothetical protein